MSQDDDRIEYLMGETPIGSLDPLDQADLDALLADLGDETTWVDPPEDLGDRVVAAVQAAARAATGSAATGSAAAGSAALDPAAGAERSEQPVPITAARSHRRRLGRLASAALGAAAAALVAVAVVRIGHDSGTQRADATIQLAGTDLLPGSAGSAAITSTASGLRIEVRVLGLPRRDGDEFYEAWLKSTDSSKLIPIGTFHEADHVILWAGVALADFPILTITREAAAGPKDPAQGSSGEVVISGKLSP